MWIYCFGGYSEVWIIDVRVAFWEYMLWFLSYNRKIIISLAFCDDCIMWTALPLSRFFPGKQFLKKKNLHSIGSKIRNRWWPCSYCDFGFVLLFWIRVSRMCFLIFFWCRNVEKLETHLHLMWNFGLKWIRSFVEGIFIIKSGSESELLTSEKP